MVAVTGEVPVFKVVKAAILPVPVPARPMLVLLFVQEYVTVPPVLVVVYEMAADRAPLHNTWFPGCVTTAVGFTVMVNVFVGPSQVTVPFSKWGVITIVAMTGAVPVFIAVNEAILPVPLAASPMVVALFVQV
jgi:hypothetical protein